MSDPTLLCTISAAAALFFPFCNTPDRRTELAEDLSIALLHQGRVGEAQRLLAQSQEHRVTLALLERAALEPPGPPGRSSGAPDRGRPSPEPRF